jgi:hypothetical protein
MQDDPAQQRTATDAAATPWHKRLAARWRHMPRTRRAGAIGAVLILANEVRGVIVVITIGLEPLRIMLAAI